MKRIWIVALTLTACADAHMGVPDGCVDDVPTCVDDCCGDVAPILDEDGCGGVCPAGSRPSSGACTPAPGCGGCGDLDAGPPPPCVGGPCCEDVTMPSLGPGCSYRCPSGFDFLCEPDPAAFCAPDERACAAPEDCAVTANTCCGECGEATLEGSTAVRRDALTSFRDGLCVGDPICPGCASQINPELVATCNAGTCEARDLGAEPITECTSSDQCRVRTIDCCECGGRTDVDSLIAIRAEQEGALLDLTCTPGFTCGGCAPIYPEDVRAECVANRCTLVVGG